MIESDSDCKRKTTSADIIRIRQLIDLMCEDFGVTRRELFIDLKYLRGIPGWKQVDLLSEIWMTYS